MTEGQKPTSIDIQASTASLVTPSLDTFTHPLAYYADNSREVGYDAGQYHPQTRLTRVGRQTRSGQLTADEKAFIASAHQSFGRSMPAALIALRAEGLAPLKASVVFEDTNDSLNSIDALQEHTGPLPVVVYPDTDAAKRPWKFKETVYQPTDYVMREFERGRELGYSGLAYDNHHVQTIGPLEEVTAQIFDAYKTGDVDIPEIHFSLGRTDTGEDSMALEKLDDFYHGRKNSGIFQLLEQIKNSGWFGRLVVEIPYFAFRNVRRRNKDNMSGKTLFEDHRRIVDNLREAFV
jgi:hypothetical protein